LKNKDNEKRARGGVERTDRNEEAKKTVKSGIQNTTFSSLQADEANVSTYLVRVQYSIEKKKSSS
jgi:ribosomal protein S20